MTPHYTDESVTLFAGDCLDVVRELEPNSVDAVVTDPPYGLEFMGSEWDGANGFRRSLNAADTERDSVHGRMSRTSPEYQAGSLFQTWTQQWAEQALRVAKPGAYMVSFGGTRTWHRMVSGLEDAGWEIRDTLCWLYGQGFPKSLDVSKAIDKAAGAEREVVGPGSYATRGRRTDNAVWGPGTPSREDVVTAPAPPDAARWQGWGTALKPGYEPIVLARKPLSGTVASNVLTHGTGALNIDGCRIGTPDGFGGGGKGSSGFVDGYEGDGFVASDKGRWPANVVLDENAAAQLDLASGVLSHNPPARWVGGTDPTEGWGNVGKAEPGGVRSGHDDHGGASRFFYTAKAGADERPRVDGVAHPTVKPLDLMRWLVRLITPPGGLVLEPFAGSGTTAEACVIEGMRCIAVERESTYLPLIEARLSKPIALDIFGAAS